MSEDAICADRSAPGDDRSAQRDDGCNLAQRIIRIAEFMTRIDDLDADRAGIDVGLASPGRLTCVPRAPLFEHALYDSAVFEHDIVRGYLALRRGELLQSRLAVLHSGVVQHDHVRPAIVLARVEIRRRRDIGDDERIRLKNGLQKGHGPEHSGYVKTEVGHHSPSAVEKASGEKTADLRLHALKKT